MDLYFLNFKRILVVMNAKDIRANILRFTEEQEIDVNIKFTNSYGEAVYLIQENEFDSYDHIVLSLSATNEKLKDFMEYLQPRIDSNPKLVIEYTREHAFTLNFSGEVDE